MKNAIRVYVYHANQIERVKDLVSIFYKHPVEYTEQKTDPSQTPYDNWIQIESNYAIWALTRKIQKLCCDVKTIEFPKSNDVIDNTGLERVEKLRQEYIKKYHIEVA